ncbi:MAG: Crp/Fnr family transcriptional regulator [Pseudomonadota bacterium]
MPTTFLRLKALPFFREIPEDRLRRIEERCAFTIYEPGQAIVAQGDAATSVHFVLSGEVRVSIFSSDGRLVHLQDMKPGAMFGELAAIDGAPRSATVEARKTSQVAGLSGPAFRKTLLEEPSLTLQILERSVELIRRLTDRVYEYAMLSVAERIQAELLRMVRATAGDGATTARLAPAPVHSDIANRVSARREAVAREMSRLAKEGVLERQGRDLLVHDVPALEAMVVAAMSREDS